MLARLRSWWQKTSKTLKIIQIGVLIGVLALIYAGYQISWTGFQNKTLWDWLNLLGVLAIPVAVGFGTVWFTQAQQHRDQELAQLQHDRDQRLADQRAQADHDAAERRAQTERDIATDNQRAAALQAYIDSMSTLLLDNKILSGAAHVYKLPTIARVRTLTLLPRLDGDRKGSVLQFLHDSGLIEIGRKIADLNGADLSSAHLNGALLYGADLSGANLSGANLRGAILTRADLTDALQPHLFGETLP